MLGRISPAQLVRDAQALLEARGAHPTRTEFRLEDHWSAADIVAYQRWMSGGPLPESPGALDLVVIAIDVQERV